MKFLLDMHFFTLQQDCDEDSTQNEQLYFGACFYLNLKKFFGVLFVLLPTFWVVWKYNEGGRGLRHSEMSTQ